MKQILLLKFIIASTCIYRFNGFHVRFDNGFEFEARVEIQYDDEERGHTVCDGGWNRNDTRVISCRHLGPESVEESANDTTDETYYEEGNHTIWFNSTSCNGTELALEQCLHSAKCTTSSSNDRAPNNYNETQFFSCNIDFQQQSSEDNENIYSTVPATAVKGLKSIRIVLSGYNNTVIIINNNNTTIINNNNTTIINNNINNATVTVSCSDPKKPFLWPFIVSAVAAVATAAILFITCLCRCLHKSPKDARNIMSFVRRLCKTQSNDDTDELETSSGSHTDSGSDTDSEIPESEAFTEQRTENSNVSGYNTYSRADNGEEEYADMTVHSQDIDDDVTAL